MPVANAKSCCITTKTSQLNLKLNSLDLNNKIQKHTNI